MFEVFHYDCPNIYSIWTTITGKFIRYRVPRESVQSFFREIGCTEKQIEDWIKSSQHINKFQVYAISYKDILKHAEEVEI